MGEKRNREEKIKRISTLQGVHLSNLPIFLPDGPAGPGVMREKENQDQNQKEKEGKIRVASDICIKPTKSLLSLSLHPKQNYCPQLPKMPRCTPGNSPPPFHQGGRLVASSCSRFIWGLCCLLVTVRHRNQGKEPLYFSLLSSPLLSSPIFISSQVGVFLPSPFLLWLSFSLPSLLLLSLFLSL